MKIFNWVHRKFHHRGDDDGFSRNVKKADVLLDGILTIGTFGFDPLSANFNPKTEYKKGESCDDEEYVVDNGGDEENDTKVCDEEVSPLVFRRFGCDSLEKNGSNYDENPLKVSNMTMAIYVSTFPLSSQPYQALIGLEDDEEKKKIRERTTLADLLAADSDDANTKRDRTKPHPDSNNKLDDHQSKKGLSFAKHDDKGLSFAKKLGQKSTRPTKNLNQLMKRMLKKKIHPDLEGKTQKRDGQIKHAGCGRLTEEYGDNESVFLLQTEGAMV
ncbi:hypothetical protein U1Q18_023760 [Sarracenia purpurea var. burkii]